MLLRQTLKILACVFVVFLTYTFFISLTGNSGPILTGPRTEAPYHCSFAPNSVPKGAYMIRFKKNHSFQKHCENVGTDMTPYLRFPDSPQIRANDFWRWYIVKGVEDWLLENIRADPGVADVQCDPRDAEHVGPGMDLPDGLVVPEEKD